MNILVACECSQVVCKAFRAAGHNAFSCDIKECYGGHPEWHIKIDVLEVINPYENCIKFHTCDNKYHYVKKWDLIIAHPPCTYLTNAGNRHLKQQGREEKRKQAADFFIKIINADCNHICVENPPGFMNTFYRPADQTIHPYFFSKEIGDENYEFKRTCLWFKNLHPLVYFHCVPPPEPYYTYVNKKGQIKNVYFVEGCKSSDRAAARSKTFPGVAEAMVFQWGGLVE